MYIIRLFGSQVSFDTVGDYPLFVVCTTVFADSTVSVIITRLGGFKGVHRYTVPNLRDSNSTAGDVKK